MIVEEEKEREDGKAAQPLRSLVGRRCE